MALSDDDVREILRIIDESDLAELRIETEGFSLHVREGRAAAAEPLRAVAASRAARRRSTAGPRERPPPTATASSIAAPMLGTFYRAEAPGRAAVRRGRQRASSRTRSSASSRS